MPSTYVLEAGFWGLPYSCFCKEVFRELGNVVSEVVQKDRFSVERVRVWVSAFRLGFLIEGISEFQIDLITEFRGPKAANAFDFSGLPTQAATGFAKNHGIDVKDLTIREIDGERYLVAKHVEKGASFVQAANDLAKKIFLSVDWGSPPWFSGMVFSQPPLYLCSVFNEMPLKIIIDGVVSSSHVMVFEEGVRKTIPISNAPDYQRIFSDLGISPQPSDRQKLIESALQQVASQGFTVRKDPLILERFSYEIERPKPVIISLPEDCVSLPFPIFQRILSDPPGYLPFETLKGDLHAKAVTFTNFRSCSEEESEFRATRLCHQFSFVHKLLSQDLTKPLEQNFESLRALPALRGPDTLYDEALRVVRHSQRICLLANVSVASELIERSVKFLYSELVTATIKKYPELKGCVLSIIAEKQGLEKEILPILKDAEVIDSNCDLLPTTVTGTVVVLGSLLEKLISTDVSSKNHRDFIAEKFLRIVISKELHLDIESFNSTISPDGISVRQFWREALVKRLSTEGFPRKKIDWFFSAPGIDPTGITQVLREWANEFPPEFELLFSLKNRLLLRFPKIGASGIGSVDYELTDPLESSLSEKLRILEGYKGCDPKIIFENLASSRAEIEACLMGLPPVIDENDSTWEVKIYLLKRSTLQINRLPTPNNMQGKQDSGALLAD